jgi:hypothetical protein
LDDFGLPVAGQEQALKIRSRKVEVAQVARPSRRGNAVAVVAVSGGCRWGTEWYMNGLISNKFCKGFVYLPSGKLKNNYGKSPFSMGKSTNSMAMFNSYVTNYQRVFPSWPCFWTKVGGFFFFFRSIDGSFNQTSPDMVFCPPFHCL